MNQQIRLLALQANPASREIYESDSWQFNCAAWSADDLKKFADLIVFECVKIAVFKGDAATGKAIKEHFGDDDGAV